MHAIQNLRKKDAALRESLARRGSDINWDAFDRLETDRHSAQMSLEEARAQRRQNSDKARAEKTRGNQSAFELLVQDGRALAERIDALEESARHLEQQQLDFVTNLPNIPHASVPSGQTDKDNRLLRVVGTALPKQNCEDHVSIAERFGGIDAEAGAGLAGSRFSVMRGETARSYSNDA